MDNGKVQFRWYDPVTGRRLTKTLPNARLALIFRADRERERERYKAGIVTAEDLERGRLQHAPFGEVLAAYQQELIRRGASDEHRAAQVRVIKAALRHADINTTLTYARLSEDPARAAIEKHGRRLMEAAGKRVVQTRTRT